MWRGIKLQFPPVVLKFLDIPKVVNFQYLTDITDKTQYYIQQMVSVLVSSAVGSSQGQTKHYEISIGCFCAAVRSKIKDLLTQNQDEWNNMSTRDSFSDLALWTSNSACWSSTKQTSSSHQNVTCSHHDTAGELLLWR